VPRHPASYRDPAGYVHERHGKLYRTVLPWGAARYGAVRGSGFLERAAASGRLIEGREVDPAVLRDEAPDAVHVLEHPAVAFVSHPYEWTFSGLRAAALLTLDLHLEALTSGVTLSDASAFNVQFAGPRPVFIDYLSFVPYEAGQVWLGYRQFCEQFLNPLLLTAKAGVAFQARYRGGPEGIPAAELSALLPWRARLDPRVALHVWLRGRLERRVTARATARAKAVRLPLSALVNNLESMRGWIAALAPRSRATPWEAYERSTHYTPEEHAQKAQFVGDAIAAARPNVVWDLGCNAGAYAEVALTRGAGLVIGFEADPGAADAAYRRAAERRLSFLPLVVDVANPSPDLGWRQVERAGMAARRNADAVLCLALLHHLVLGRNLPLAQVIEWLVDLAPRGVLEFVPREDPMAAQLVALKPDIAPEYKRDTAAALLAARARVERTAVVTASGRTLFAWSRA
jgi:ribosomal protein L11 methylase PrmA